MQKQYVKKCLGKPSTSNSAEQGPRTRTKAKLGQTGIKQHCDVLWSSRTTIFTSGVQSRPVTIGLLNLLVFRQPGVVAHACNPGGWGCWMA